MLVLIPVSVYAVLEKKDISDEDGRYRPYLENPKTDRISKRSVFKRSERDLVGWKIIPNDRSS